MFFGESSPFVCSCLLVLPVPLFPCCRMGRTSRACARFVWNFLGPRLLPRYQSAFLVRKSPGRYASNCDLAKMFKCFDELCRTLCKNRSWLYCGLMTNHVAFFTWTCTLRNILKLLLRHFKYEQRYTQHFRHGRGYSIFQNSSIDAIKINQQASIDKLDLTILWHILNLPSWSTSRFLRQLLQFTTSKPGSGGGIVVVLENFELSLKDPLDVFCKKQSDLVVLGRMMN